MADYEKKTEEFNAYLDEIERKVKEFKKLNLDQVVNDTPNIVNHILTFRDRIGRDWFINLKHIVSCHKAGGNWLRFRDCNYIEVEFEYSVQRDNIYDQVLIDLRS